METHSLSLLVAFAYSTVRDPCIMSRGLRDVIERFRVQIVSIGVGSTPLATAR